ncbi:BTAD domain-containing putative transcriptional regulator [Streptomyces sp. NPDC050504]|uniref:BTAD domain-containing putative transcriptional regulator n=1 Tax=Streptomyces sp. NPDC050504 TaxID=3365618 RepID=UPI00379C5BE7
MRFQLLGPLSLRDGQEAVVLQPSKPTILLSALLIHANGVVSADYLQRAVWGEEQPATAKAALQTCVLRLRRLFTKHAVTETPIEAVPGGYRISAGPDTLDLIGFRELVGRAGGETREPESELLLLKQALGLWQGSLLANVRSDLLHRDEVPRLTEERLRVQERVCDLELGLGRCGEALAQLWSVTRENPGYERFHEQLIEALYRTGRQAEALAEYRRVKEYLLDELGVDPSPALRRLELSILRGEYLGPGAGVGPGPGESAALGRAAARPALGPGSGASGTAAHGTAALGAASPGTAAHGAVQLGTAAFGAVPLGALASGTASSGARGVARGATSSTTSGLAPHSAPHTAPHPVPHGAAAYATAAYPVAPVGVEPLPGVPSFTGRAADVAAMADRLTAVRDEPVTVLVSGAPGIGKSALAHHVAHQVRDAFPGGTLLVRMTAPDGTPRPAEDAAAEISAALRDRRPGQRALLVLDDVTDADQARPLLPTGPTGPTGPGSPGTADAVVVTSRLGLAGLIATHGGWVQRLSVFEPAESYGLLRALLGPERVDAEPDAARALAEVCGHFPLALRIAAARLLTRPGLLLADAAGWFAGAPLARLALAGPDRMSVARVLGGAVARLDPRLAEAYERIGALPSGAFHAEDCAAVLGPGTSAADAEDVLERLADAGFLEEGPPGPYRMHELLRVHARGAPPDAAGRPTAGGTTRGTAGGTTRGTARGTARDSARETVRDIDRESVNSYG